MKMLFRGRTRLAAAILAAVLLVTAASPAMAEVFSAIVTSGSMAVYSDAKLTAQVDTLGQDTVVRVQAYSGKAAKITYEGGSGYASIADMKAVDSVAAKALVVEDAKVYASADTGAQAAAVGSGTRVYVLGYSGDWATVEKDGKVGYMLLTALEKANSDWSAGAPVAAPTPTPMPTEPGVVTADSLTVYKEESTSSGKVTTFKKGQSVNVVSWNNQWAMLALDGGKAGYVQVKGIRPVEETASAGSMTVVSVTVSKLPVYALANGGGEKLGTLSRGQEVNLVSVSGGWAYIELGGNYGYAEASGLSIDDDPAPTVGPTPTPSVENAVEGTVNVSTLTVYKTASKKADTVATLSKGAKVNVIQYNSDWAFIEFSGKYGFCAVTGLTRADAAAAATVSPTATPGTAGAVSATVTDDSVAVYATAGTSSSPLGTLMWGEKVNVLSVSDGWAYIELDGKYGFCAASALSKVDGDAAPTPTPAPAPADFVNADFSATVIAKGAKAYASADTSSNSQTVALGAEVYVTGYSKDLNWASVESGNARAYMRIAELSRGTYAAVTTSGAASQALLKGLLNNGYYDGQVTAAPTSDMAVEAIKRFQADCGLEQTGVADQTLQRILYGGSAPTSELLVMSMSVGSYGEDVRRLQTRLYVLGYLSQSASLDSDYGSATATAVALFQQANGLTASGIADGATLKALYSTAANARPSSIAAADDGGSATIAEPESGGSVSTTGVVTPPSKVTLSSTYVTTMPSSLKATISSYSDSLSNAQKLEHVIYVAQSNLTKPYVYGATGPNSFDCSGLTQYCFKKVNVSIKRTAYSQGYDTSYTKISSVSSLKRGDLVFFNTISDSDLCDHVGIYLGGGCFIHASSGGHKVVVSNIASGYYNRVFSWGRRILK